MSHYDCKHEGQGRKKQHLTHDTCYYGLGIFDDVYESCRFDTERYSKHYQRKDCVKKGRSTVHCDVQSVKLSNDFLTHKIRILVKIVSKFTNF